jgi:hypothetical protein
LAEHAQRGRLGGCFLNRTAYPSQSLLQSRTPLLHPFAVSFEPDVAHRFNLSLTSQDQRSQSKYVISTTNRAVSFFFFL